MITLSLSPSLTHTHNQFHSLLLFLRVKLFLTLSIPLSLIHTHTHTHLHTHTLTITLKPADTHTHICTQDSFFYFLKCKGKTTLLSFYDLIVCLITFLSDCEKPFLFIHCQIVYLAFHRKKIFLLLLDMSGANTIQINFIQQRQIFSYFFY